MIFAALDEVENWPEFDISRVRISNYSKHDGFSQILILVLFLWDTGT